MQYIEESTIKHQTLFLERKEEEKEKKKKKKDRVW